MVKIPSNEQEVLRKLGKLNRYCKIIPEKEGIDFGKLQLKEQYFLTYFVYGTSFSEAVHVLLRNGKSRGGVPVLRALYESWLNIRLIYSNDDLSWVYNLYANAAKSTVKAGVTYSLILPHQVFVEPGQQRLQIL